MTVYIAPIARGLGDLVLSLPAVQYLVDTGEPTYLVLRSPMQMGFEELIPGLAGSVREIDLCKRKLSPSDRIINLRDHPLQTDYIWGSQEFDKRYPGFHVTDVVEGICKDFGIPVDFDNLKALPYTAREDAAGKVLFIAGSAGPFKCWQKERWLELARLLVARGEQVAVVGQPDESPEVAELLQSGLQWVPTPAYKDALDVLSSGRAVVAVDTGLMHLALHQRVPVTAIWVNNPCYRLFLRKEKHCFPVLSPVCRPDCSQALLDEKPNAHLGWEGEWKDQTYWACFAPESERCMNNVPVEAVLAQVEKALEFASKRARCSPVL